MPVYSTTRKPQNRKTRNPFLANKVASAVPEQAWPWLKMPQWAGGATVGAAPQISREQAWPWLKMPPYAAGATLGAFAPATARVMGQPPSEARKKVAQSAQAITQAAWPWLQMPMGVGAQIRPINPFRSEAMAGTPPIQQQPFRVPATGLPGPQMLEAASQINPILRSPVEQMAISPQAPQSTAAQATPFSAMRPAPSPVADIPTQIQLTTSSQAAPIPIQGTAPRPQFGEPIRMIGSQFATGEEIAAETARQKAAGTYGMEIPEAAHRRRLSERGLPFDVRHRNRLARANPFLARQQMIEQAMGQTAPNPFLANWMLGGQEYATAASEAAARRAATDTASAELEIRRQAEQRERALGERGLGIQERATGIAEQRATAEREEARQEAQDRQRRLEIELESLKSERMEAENRQRLEEEKLNIAKEQADREAAQAGPATIFQLWQNWKEMHPDTPAPPTLTEKFFKALNALPVQAAAGAALGTMPQAGAEPINPFLAAQSQAGTSGLMTRPQAEQQLALFAERRGDYLTYATMTPEQKVEYAEENGLFDLAEALAPLGRLERFAKSSAGKDITELYQTPGGLRTQMQGALLPFFLPELTRVAEGAAVGSVLKPKRQPRSRSR